MDTLPVTLIVKAANQAEYEDQMVKCELSWTIRRLKGHLAEVYPCKPVSYQQLHQVHACIKVKVAGRSGKLANSSRPRKSSMLSRRLARTHTGARRATKVHVIIHFD